MIPAQDWLWDRKIGVKRAKVILRDPDNKHFLSLAGLLLSRKNSPRDVLKVYLRPFDFLQNWPRIKKQMRKDAWNNPRIEFWQAIYEKIREKYKGRKVSFKKQAAVSGTPDEFCKTVANKIKDIRKERGLTQEGLAKKLKVSQQLVSRVEKGRENISLLTLKNIVDKLGARIHLELS